MSPHPPSAHPAKFHPPSRKRLTILTRRRFTRHHLEYCDCGNLAVTVLEVLVGTDPQYRIRMPLCPTCLKLEQDLEQDL